MATRGRKRPNSSLDSDSMEIMTSSASALNAGAGSGGGGGFIVNGSIDLDQRSRWSFPTVIDLLSDEEEEKEGKGFSSAESIVCSGRSESDTEEEEEEESSQERRRKKRRSDEDREEEEIQLVAIRPKSKSRLIAPPPRTGGDANSSSSSSSSTLTPEAEIVAEREDFLNLEEKSGYIKECIEDDGLGTLFSPDSGLVLFHLDHCCVDEEKVGPWAFADVLKPGTEVKFLDSFHEGNEYSTVSSEAFLRQAVAVWVGPRPQHLLRYVVTEEHKTELQRHRSHFLDHITDGRLLHVSHARIKGSITGFLTSDIGLLETFDIEDPRSASEQEPQMVLFNVRDVHVYRKRATSYIDFENPLPKVLPVGLRVIFDARIIPRFCGVSFQAISVFAGTWPSVPHPTLLPSRPGQSSFSGCLALVPPEHAFYYLQLSLKVKLNEDVEMFKTEADQNGTQLQHSDFVINNGSNFRGWQDIYAPSRFLKNRDNPKRNTMPRNRRANQNDHIFKRAPLKIKKKTKEIKEDPDEFPALRIKLEHSPLIVKKEKYNL